MSKQTITADHLNATHLGKRVSILDNGEVVMSGTLKIPRMNNMLLLHGHTHAHDPLEFGRHHNEINVGLDAWCFEPVNEAELVDNWLPTALSVTE